MTATPATTPARRTSAKASSALPPHVLREYALLADGERGVVVGPRGDIAWMCVPRWDSDAIFSALIGGHGRLCRHPGRHLRVGRLLRRRRR